MPKKLGVNIPATLERSPQKAQRTYAKTLRSAEAEYGSGERAGRTAYASLKHGFEKVGDHWEAKTRKGPSGPKAPRSVGDKQSPDKAESYGGVDAAGHTRQELLQRAKTLGVTGRSAMNKQQLARAIAGKRR